MKVSLTLLLTLAAIAALSVVAMVSRQTLRDPRVILDEVIAGLTSGELDPQAGIRRIDSALRRAEAMDVELEGVAEICVDLRLQRGHILREIGANEEARAEYQLVLDRYRPGDSDVRRLLVQTDVAAGDLIGALGRLEALLQDQPEYGPAWVEAGRMHLSLAREALDRCALRSRELLATTDAARAAELLERLASLDPADHARTQTILELRELFPVSEEEELGQILELCEVAGEEMGEARRAYVRSFEFGIDPSAIAGYLKVLVPAGRDQEAIRLGTLALRLSGELESTSADTAGGELLVRTLAAREDWNRAAEISTLWLQGNTPLPASFLRIACHVFFQNRSWNLMHHAANNLRLIGSADDEVLAALYHGFAFARAATPNLDRALQSLSQYARSMVAEPFENARALAWRAISEIHRARGDLANEREAIQAVIKLAPDLDGELWLRRAEIQMDARHAGYLLPLGSWAKAMSLLPLRTDELMPQFVTLGERVLATQERSIDQLEREMREAGRTLPTRDYDPYSLYRLAQGRGLQGNYRGQAALAQRLWNQLPGFLPALDERIDASRGQGNLVDFVELSVQRAELAGLDEHSRELLAEIEPEDLDPSQILRLMVVDIRGRGRERVARWMYQRGETRDALRTLQTGSPELRSDGEWLFGAQMMMEQGNYAGALEWLDGIDDESPHAEDRLHRTLMCALKLDDEDRVRQLLTGLFTQESADAGELLAISDLLLRHDQTEIALRLLGDPEQRPAAERGADLFRRALIATRDGTLDVAEELLERAEAFVPEKDAGVLRLIIDSRREDWIMCERTARALRQRDGEEDPIRTALLYLLEGREEEALEIAEFALELTDEVFAWQLVASIARLRLGMELSTPAHFGKRAEAQTPLFLGSGEDSTVDCRQVAALLLATDLPALSPFLQAELGALKPTERGLLWPGLVHTYLLKRDGHLDEAARELTGLTETFRDCRPLWDALEDVVSESLPSPDHPRLVKLRRDRLVAYGRTYPTGVEASVLRARRLADQGDYPEALRIATAAVEKSSERPEALLEQARILSEMRNWEPALAAWRRLILDGQGPEARLGVGGLIEMLEEALRATPPGLDTLTVLEVLQETAVAHPHDPRPPLALARLDLLEDPLNPSIGIERAWSRLANFREEHRGVPLEDLQRGATGEWARFYVEMNPTAAEEFIGAELQLLPGDIELWRLLGRVQRELGKLRESAVVLNRAARMADDPRVYIELAFTFLESGASPRQISSALDSAIALSRKPETLESQLIRAEGVLDRFEERAWPGALAKLEKLWASRSPALSSPDLAKLGELYARALLLRDDDGDAQTALEVLDEALEVADPLYQREYFLSLRGIASSLTLPI